MPKYRFVCGSCKRTEQSSVAVRTKTLTCPICAGSMERQLPVIKDTQVEETVNQLTNTTWKQDQREIVKARKEDYYWKHMVPKLVEEHSLQTALENKWVYYAEDGSLKIYDKPPGNC